MLTTTRFLRRSALLAAAFATTGSVLAPPAAAVAGPLPARALPPPQLPVPIRVTTTADAGPGSLRQAILDANADVGHDVIHFDIAAAGVQTIVPATELDPITEKVTIDGYSQLGALAATPFNDAVMMIVIDAAGLGHGLEVATNSSTVKGLVVQNAAGPGIRVTGGSNVVAGNYLGTTDTGVAGAGNTVGVEVHGDGNVVGGSTAAARNVVSANVTGVAVESGTGNRVLGNRIGTDAAGTGALGNADGVVVRAGSTDVVDNVVSGNTADGIGIQATSVVLRNRVGTTASGNAALPNGQDGIFVEAPGTVVGAPGDGNLVSANGDNGISLITGAEGARVQANTVGTTAAGAPLGNGADGVESDAPGVAIEGNTVSANADHGLSVAGDDTVIEGNTVGGAAAGLGNAAEGIEVSGDGSRVAHNQIAGNGAEGVLVSGGIGSTVLSNAITANGALGLDLGGSGVLLNDAGDVDAGANDLLNYPTIPGAVTVNGVTTVDWKIDDGLRASTQRLELYGQPSCDVLGHGEGRRFLGSVVVTTGATDGSVSGRTELATSVPTGQVVVATATVEGPATAAALGSTSEFSPCTVVA